MYTLGFICAFGLFAALQVPGTLAEPEGVVPASKSEQTEIVDKHNALRRGVQPTASNMLKMSWSSEAEAKAQKLANTCSLDHTPKGPGGVSTSGCGENLYMNSFKNSWSNAIQYWYDEVKDWRYGVGSVNGRAVGHYTQVVWYRSNQVGCAVAYCPNAKYKYFYVCQYCPTGNFQLAKPYKSGPTCGDCSDACDNKLCTNVCRYIDQYPNCPSLKAGWGCSNSQVATWCPGSCGCTTEIV